MVNIDRHTHPTKRSGRIPVTCAVCHRQFEARRRTARFCGTRCRKVAERRRGEPSKMDVTVNRRPSALAVGTRSPKSAERTSPRRCAASSAADVTLNHPVDIVPDAHWPNMWRLAYQDGRLSGMVNLTRARDALHGRRYPRVRARGRRWEQFRSVRWCPAIKKASADATGTERKETSPAC